MREHARSRARTARIDALAEMLALGGRSLGFLAIIAGFLIGLRIVAGAV